MLKRFHELSLYNRTSNRDILLKQFCNFETDVKELLKLLGCQLFLHEIFGDIMEKFDELLVQAGVLCFLEMPASVR